MTVLDKQFNQLQNTSKCEEKQFQQINATHYINRFINCLIPTTAEHFTAPPEGLSQILRYEQLHFLSDFGQTD